jgi:molybdenum cofactor biosynthesis enzyme MoaA
LGQRIGGILLKNFTRDTYIPLSLDTVREYMLAEYPKYRKITDNFVLNGIPYYVCGRVNMQLRTTLACQANCAFCIEKTSPKTSCVNTEMYLKSLNEALTILHEAGITPTITITGGEPLLNRQKFFGILDILQNFYIPKFNLNTNGFLLDEEILHKIVASKMPHLNISRHHYDDTINQEILDLKNETPYSIQEIKSIIGGTYDDVTRIRLQCVLIKGFIDDIASVKKYLDWTISEGLDNVAFRGLSKLKGDAANESLETVRYCEEKAVDIFTVLRDVASDPDFELVAQNISDHYTYEDWRYKGKVDVHFAYSDMDILEEYEVKELKDNELFAREFVLYEDNSFCGGWNKDIKFIK